jgi:RsiW-degrading membrane proteinase PrsW (M82 family)
MYRLRVHDGPRAGDAIPLAAGAPLVLGRGYDAIIRFPDDPQMSRVHAELVPVGNAWLLKNRSVNGTLVGGAVMKAERLLKAGDELTLGATRIVFEKDPAAPATPATPAPGAVAPEGAGYDTKGAFHTGYSFISASLKEADSSGNNSAILVPATPYKVKRRTLQFFLIMFLAALVGVGLLSATLLLPLLRTSPREFFIAAGLALLPTIPYLAAYKLLDRNAQIPLRDYLACFFWGGSVACGVSVVLTYLAGSLFTSLTGAGDGAVLRDVVAAPLVEETMKGLSVLVVFLILREEFNDAVAGLILGAAAGLGFALVENCVYDARYLQDGMKLATFVWEGTYRTLTTALVGHPVYTAMTGLGFGIAREMKQGDRRRVLLPLLGWLVAVLMHGGWNYASILVPQRFGRGHATDLGLALFFGGACAIFFLMATFYALAKERRVLLDHLSDEVEKGFIEPAELESFKTLFGRERFVLEGVKKNTYALRKSLRRAQLELAFRKWHLKQGDDVRGTAVDRVLLDARERIRDARNAINAREGRVRAKA